MSSTFTSPARQRPAASVTPSFPQSRGRTDGSPQQSIPTHQMISGASPHTHKAQRERSETQRSVLSGMSWKFLTETTLEERDWQPPTVLTKEGMEYVQKLERERRQQQLQQQHQQQQQTAASDANGRISSRSFNEDGTTTPTPAAAPLRTIFSELVSPSHHSAYYSPPVAPRSIQEKLGLFTQSPSNATSNVANARSQSRARSTTPNQPSRGPQFHADTPLKRAQAAAAINAKKTLLEKFHPVDPVLVRVNSRKELPPLPPKLEAQDLNITNEVQQREEGVMEAQREEKQDLQRAYDTLEQSILDMTLNSIKDSQSIDLPAPHPVLDRSARKPAKKARKRVTMQDAHHSDQEEQEDEEETTAGEPNQGAVEKVSKARGTGSKKSSSIATTANQVEEKEERSDGQPQPHSSAAAAAGQLDDVSDESTDPELDDDAALKQSRRERARAYHAQMLGGLTDPFVDEKRSRHELSPKKNARQASIDTAAGIATASQIILWRESSRIREATDVPSGIAQELLSEPTDEDCRRFVRRLNKAQQEEAAAKELQEVESAKRHQQDRISRLRVSEEDESSGAHMILSPTGGVRSLDVPDPFGGATTTDFLGPRSPPPVVRSVRPPPVRMPSLDERSAANISLMDEARPGRPPMLSVDERSASSPGVEEIRPTLDMLSPSHGRTYSMLYTTGSSSGVPLSPTSTTFRPSSSGGSGSEDSFRPMSPGILSRLPQPEHILEKLDADTHANPFHQHLPTKHHDLDDSVEHLQALRRGAVVGASDAGFESSDIGYRNADEHGNSYAQSSRSPDSGPSDPSPGMSPYKLHHPPTPKLSNITLAPATPSLRGIAYEPHVLDPTAYAYSESEFALDHAEVESKSVVIESKKIFFEYTSSNDARDQARIEERRRKEVEERSEAILSGGVILKPMSNKEKATRGLPGFQFSAQAREESKAAGGPNSDVLVQNPVRAAEEFARVAKQAEASAAKLAELSISTSSSPQKYNPTSPSSSSGGPKSPVEYTLSSTDFSPLSIAARSSAAAKWRRKEEARARKAALSPSKNNPLPAFRPTHVNPGAYSHLNGSSVVPPVRASLPKKSLGAWYLSPSQWKVSLASRSNEDTLAEEEEEEQRAKSEESIPKALSEKQSALDESIPTLFIASVYKGHLEKIARQQQEKAEKEAREEKAKQENSVYGRYGLRSPPPQRVSISITSPTGNQSSTTPGGSLDFRPPSLPVDPLASTPVRVPPYLSSLIPLDPLDPETVIVDFAPGTNQVSAPTGGAGREERKSKWSAGGAGGGGNSPSKGSAAKRVQTPDAVKGDHLRPMSPPNPNVHAYRAAEAAREAQIAASGVIGGGSGNTNMLNSPSRPSVSAGSISFATPSKSPLTPSNAAGSASSTKKKTHHSANSISQMIITHQSLAAAAAMAMSAEEQEAEQLLSKHPQQKFDAIPRSGRGSPVRSPSGGSLALPAANTPGSRRRSINVDPSQVHLLKGIGIISPDARARAAEGKGAGGKHQHGKHSSITFHQPVRETIAGLAQSHHAHTFLPNIQVGSGSMASGHGGKDGQAQRERVVSLSMRAYIMTQAQAEADAVRAHAMAERGEVEREKEFDPDEPEFQHPLEVGSKRDPIAVIQVRPAKKPAGVARRSSLVDGPTTVGTEAVRMERVVDGDEDAAEEGDPTEEQVAEESQEEEEEQLYAVPAPATYGRPRVRVVISDDGQLIHNPSTLVHVDSDGESALSHDTTDRRFDPANSVISPLVSPTAAADMHAVRKRFAQQELVLKQPAQWQA